MKKYIILLLVLTLCLTGCGMSSEEKEQEKAYIERHSDDFEAQAKKQYGNDAKVKKIEIVTYTTSGGVWPTSHTVFTKKLRGVIKTKNEKFKGTYYVDEGIIYSTKNNLNIKKDIYNYIESLNIKVLDIAIQDNARDSDFYLPDNIVNLSDYLQTDHLPPMYIYIFTTSDISKYNEDNFKKFINNNQEQNSQLYIIELKDKSNLKELKNRVLSSNNNIDLSNPVGTIYEDTTHIVNAFEKYNILYSLHISNNNKFELKYNLKSACPYKKNSINLLEKYNYLDKVIIPKSGVVTDIIDYDDHFSFTVECVDLDVINYRDNLIDNNYEYVWNEGIYINNKTKIKIETDDSLNYRAVISVYKIKE